MGMFSGFPADLEPVRSTVRAAATQIALYGRGLSEPEAYNELTAAARQEMRSARKRLIAEGRRNDVKKLQKRLMNDGTFMDTPVYNRIYGPFIWSCLDESYSEFDAG